jgi:hypothetical protein
MYSTTRQYAAHQSDRRQARSQLLAGWLIDEPAGSLLCRRCVPAVYAKKACKSLGIKAGGIEISCKPFAGPGGPLTLAKFKTEVRFPEAFTPDQKSAILESITHCAVKDIVVAGAAIDFQAVEI